MPTHVIYVVDINGIRESGETPQTIAKRLH